MNFRLATELNSWKNANLLFVLKIIRKISIKQPIYRRLINPAKSDFGKINKFIWDHR